ncbi:MAG: hypothetical protein FWB76_04265 [Oscillospiraceae bacterium]|nr:hypothetical protein [Oscillospiraceae bacterium]
MMYFIYRAQPKITQLYQQLPQSRVTAQKRITHSTQRSNVEIHHKAKQEHTKFKHDEQQLQAHEIAQLQRVVQALRKAGQLHREPPRHLGQFYDIAGEFAPCHCDNTPEGYVWLASKHLRLLCRLEEFAGYGELFAAGQALPLQGVVLWVGYALPLCLWME